LSSESLATDKTLEEPYLVLWDYSGTDSKGSPVQDALLCTAGDILLIGNLSEDADWTRATSQNKNKTGVVPTKYLQKLDNAEIMKEL
jgi:hypothetical protein